MRKPGLREVKLLAQGHTAKLVAELESRSGSDQSLLHSLISKPCVFIHKRKILPALDAIARTEMTWAVGNNNAK